MKLGTGLKLADIKSVVFSGGGSRCLWQAGVWKVLSKQSEFKPSTIAAASAGATMACLLLAGKADLGLEYFKRKTALNKKNAYWLNLFTHKKVFPHYEIYRTAIFDLIDEKDLAILKRGPETRILISQPPRWLGPRSGSFIGMATYSLEKLIRYPMHPKYTTKLGYTPKVVKLSECSSVDDLADLLLQSSCTPPFVPIMKRNGKPALDGGLIDNVPIGAVADKPGKKMVLLSRQYPDNRIPKAKDNLYFQPSQPVAISKWDYTNPQGLQFAYDLGKKDAEKVLESIEKP